MRPLGLGEGWATSWLHDLGKTAAAFRNYLALGNDQDPGKAAVARLREVLPRWTAATDHGKFSNCPIPFLLRACIALLSFARALSLRADSITPGHCRTMK